MDTIRFHVWVELPTPEDRDRAIGAFEAKLDDLADEHPELTFPVQADVE
jgi:hypothetical protein